MKISVEPVLVNHLKKHYLDNFYTKQGELCNYLLIIQRLKEIASQYLRASTLLFKYFSKSCLQIATTLYRVYEIIHEKITLISTALIKTLPPKIDINVRGI